MTSSPIRVRGRPAASARVLLRERDEEPVRTLLGRETPCVGRERELAVLEACFAECVDEPRARPVVVTGGVGVGKTRVGYEFLRRVRARKDGAAIWIARADPTSAGSPLGLLGQIVRRAAEIADGEPLPERRQRIRAKVASRIASPDASRVAEFLGELAGAPFSEDASVRLRAARADPMLMADQLLRAFQEFVLAECRAQPVVIVLEDLQWGDRPTVAFLDAALAAAGELPLLVVAFGRPELFDLFPDIWSLRDAEVVRLGPIGKKAAEKLVAAALPGADAAKIAVIVERAAGNAFFLEELIRSAAESRDDAVPATVLAMIQARLEALDPESRRILRAGSIFGQTFWSGGVGALLVAGERTARVDEVLDALAERELVARRAASRFPGEQEHTFRHGLVRDAAYATLTAEDRRLGHRLVAGWLERAGETDPLALAEHFELGGELDAASERWLATAHQALDANDLPSAIERAARAAATATRPECRGAARALEASALLWTGRLGESEERVVDALSALPRGSGAWIDAANTAVLALGRLSRFDRVVAMAEELRALFDRDAPAGPLVAAASRAAVFLCAAGRFELADDLLARLGEVPSAELEAFPSAAIQRDTARTMRALYGGDVGRFLEGMEAHVVAREAIGDVRVACSNRISVGFACIELGVYSRAEETLRESLAAAQRMGLLPLVASAQNNLGVALAMQGKLAEAHAFEARAVEAFEAQGDAHLEGGSRVVLAEIHALAGQLDAAAADAGAAIDLLDRSPTLRCHALATLARGSRSPKAMSRPRSRAPARPTRSSPSSRASSTASRSSVSPWSNRSRRQATKRARARPPRPLARSASSRARRRFRTSPTALRSSRTCPRTRRPSPGRSASPDSALVIKADRGCSRRTGDRDVAARVAVRRSSSRAPCRARRARSSDRAGPGCRSGSRSRASRSRRPRRSSSRRRRCCTSACRR